MKEGVKYDTGKVRWSLVPEGVMDRTISEAGQRSGRTINQEGSATTRNPRERYGARQVPGRRVGAPGGWGPVTARG
jgi:hypothetical protein